MKHITIKGAKTHNLKNISLKLPRDKLIVITGPSGSGKSSLAFDTIYAEGQRRYVESLSSYARQFLSMMEKPDVEHIEGLSPAIAIEQKTTSHNPRSTVGTTTEIYDYLRLLFARVGTPKCPKHNKELNAQTVSQMIENIFDSFNNKKIMILSPVVQNKKGTHKNLFEKLYKEGFIKARVNNEIYELDEPPELKLHQKHNIDIIIDRLKIPKNPDSDLKQRLAESLETGLNLSDGIIKISEIDNLENEVLFSANFACPLCGYNLKELEPRLFSFNSPVGACNSCDGLGAMEMFDIDKLIIDKELSLAQDALHIFNTNSSYYYQLIISVFKHFNVDINTAFKKLPKKFINVLFYGSDEIISFQYIQDTEKKSPSRFSTSFTKDRVFEGILNILDKRYKQTSSNYMADELRKYMSRHLCDACSGSRLCLEARNIFINNINITDITKLSVQDSLLFFKKLNLIGNKKEIATNILKEISSRLEFLNNVGLNYLTLSRNTDSLSGGEAQRIRLASQIGAGLVGVMYVLDEPTIGLHQRDNARLIKTLTNLRDLGNTIIVVEHDEEVMQAADHIIDIGPYAGIHGGNIVAEGNIDYIKKHKKSITGQYLSKKRLIKIPEQRIAIDKTKLLIIENANINNLKNLTLKIPKGLFTCVTGVSGSGKSTLINRTLYPLINSKINKSNLKPELKQTNIINSDLFDKIINIDQSPIGRTPRSNPATYTGLFTYIRDLLAGTQEARSRGYKAGRFSFNVKGGRCEACQGDGVTKVEMHFLADLYITCEVCHGKRYNPETLEVLYKGKNIAQILDFTIEQAHEFFNAIPNIASKLKTLIDVGLGYMHLGQNATTLSGGEAQRVKLAKELSKRDSGNTLYILDEPTTGLHFQDIELLLKVLHRLRDKGNTIIVIEHNLDVIKTADWIIDLGPEGGKNGGEIIAEGTPEKVSNNKKSFTGKYLKQYL
tara:strand:- start:4505 stop:7357 length:2853 start_codon:yes stop_codon:yes gene_type:complete